MAKKIKFNLGLGYLMLALCIMKSTTNKITQAQIIANQGRTNVNWLQIPRKINAVSNVTAEIAKLNTTYEDNMPWPSSGEKLKLGAVSAVTFDKDLNVVIFHRVNRIWNAGTFTNNNVYTEKNNGPIHQNTVLAFDRKFGDLQYEWGKNLFYMPHGLTIDKDDNCWVTDVALHQVMKFGPRGGVGQPLMVLGTAFVPGASERHFCKPTSVAVLENGDFFVADGYCNARIVKFNKHGERILYWGQNSFSGISYDIAPVNYFAIPHALTLITDLQLICAADRENGRIQCFHWTNGTFYSQYYNDIIGDRLFSMDYTPANGGQFVIVNGPTLAVGGVNNQVWGFVMDFKTKRVVSKFGPKGQQFHNPHDIAVTPDGKEIYVAELTPMRIHKFAVAHSLSRISQDAVEHINSTPDVSAKDNNIPSIKAIVVVTLMLLFAVSTFLLALYMARRRQRGNNNVGVGQPNELVYRRLVASCSSVAVD